MNALAMPWRVVVSCTRIRCDRLAVLIKDDSCRRTEVEKERGGKNLTGCNGLAYDVTGEHWPWTTRKLLRTRRLS